MDDQELPSWECRWIANPMGMMGMVWEKIQRSFAE